MLKQVPTMARRAFADPQIMFSRIEFDRLVENVVIEESALRDTANAPPLSEKEMDRLRQMMMFRLAAELQPAGNA